MLKMNTFYSAGGQIEKTQPQAIGLNINSKVFKSSFFVLAVSVFLCRAGQGSAWAYEADINEVLYCNSYCSLVQLDPLGLTQLSSCAAAAVSTQDESAFVGLCPNSITELLPGSDHLWLVLLWVSRNVILNGYISGKFKQIYKLLPYQCQLLLSKLVCASNMPKYFSNAILQIKCFYSLLYSANILWIYFSKS